MNELVAFLLARIAEDKAAARALTDTLPWRQGTHPSPGWDGDVVHLYPDESGQVQWPTVHEGAAFLARFNPARMLAECEAKEQIIDAAQEALVEHQIGTAKWLRVLRALVQPYAEHPNFHAEWRL